MGIEMLPVVLEPDATAWALTCNSCEPRTWVVHPDLIEYGQENPDVLRLVAFHEACHVYRGHDGFGMGQMMAEVEVFGCVEKFLGISWKEQEEIHDAANAWRKGVR
jgi:hypothetical protein